MKGFFQNLSMKMARWMQGRYGVDGLSNGLMALGVITMLLSIIPHLDLLSWVAIACMAVALYRMYSKNFARRRKENEAHVRARQESVGQPQNHPLLQVQELRPGAVGAARQRHLARGLPQVQNRNHAQVVKPTPRSEPSLPLPHRRLLLRHAVDATTAHEDGARLNAHHFALGENLAECLERASVEALITELRHHDASVS